MTTTSLTSDYRAIGLALLCAPCLSAGATEESVAIRPSTPIRAVFSESEVRLVYHFMDEEAAPREVRWSVTTTGRVIARGEAKVVRAEGKPARLEVAFRTPAVRDGLSLACQIRVEAGPGLECSGPLWVYSLDAFAGRRALWKADQLIVFDPEGATTERLLAEKLPHKLVGRLPRPGEARQRLLLVGEAVELDEHPALRRRLADFAAKGGRGLCLAPASGGFPLADVGEPAPTVKLFSLESLAERYKRLDIGAFSYAAATDSPAVVRLSLATGRRSLRIETHADTPAWALCQADYPGQGSLPSGRIVVCGYPTVEAWDAGPTPRYLFAALLSSFFDHHRQ